MPAMRVRSIRKRLRFQGNDAKLYLDYLDKEMTIMGVLSTFCVAVVGSKAEVEARRSDVGFRSESVAKLGRSRLQSLVMSFDRPLVSTSVSIGCRIVLPVFFSGGLVHRLLVTLRTLSKEAEPPLSEPQPISAFAVGSGPT